MPCGLAKTSSQSLSAALWDTVVTCLGPWRVFIGLYFGVLHHPGSVPSPSNLNRKESSDWLSLSITADPKHCWKFVRTRCLAMVYSSKRSPSGLLQREPEFFALSCPMQVHVREVGSVRPLSLTYGKRKEFCGCLLLNFLSFISDPIVQLLVDPGMQSYSCPVPQDPLWFFSLRAWSDSVLRAATSNHPGLLKTPLRHHLPHVSPSLLNGKDWSIDHASSFNPL